jgi:hypothetical protein
MEFELRLRLSRVGKKRLRRFPKWLHVHGESGWWFASSSLEGMAVLIEKG